MKELLKLTPGHDGAVWSYTSSGLARRRSHCHDELELNLVTAGTARRSKLNYLRGRKGKQAMAVRE